MKALVLQRFAGTDGLDLVEVPDPTPAPGQVVIRVHTAGANRLDLAVMHGKAPGDVRLPQIIGSDPAGEVVALGTGVTGFERGDHVVVKPNVACWRCDDCDNGFEDSCSAQTIVGVDLPGGTAEYVAVTAGNVFRLPPEVSSAAATAAAHSFPIALQMLRERAGLTARDRVLVTGASGAVGSAAVQLAKHEGALVIAATSSPEKAEVAHGLGADHSIVYDDPARLPDQLADLTAGRGVTLVVDTAGDPTILTPALAALSRRGRAVLCGAHGGRSLEVDPRWLYRQRTELIGSSSPSYAAFRDVLALTATSSITPLIHEVLPWAEYRAAYRLLQERRNAGKVVLQVSTKEDRDR